MSKTTDKLNLIKIYNDYDITDAGHPFVSIRIPSSREVTPKSVRVFVKGKSFKNSAWYEDGGKCFSYQGGKEGRDDSIKKAMDLIERLFPGMKMVKSPFGRFAWVPEEDLKKKLETKEENHEENKEETGN